MSTMLMDVVNGVLNAMATMLIKGFELGAPLAAAVLLLVVGTFLAHWARICVDYATSEVQLDSLCDRAGLNPLIQRLGMGRSPAKIAGFLAYWAMVLAFLLPAADVAGLPVVRDYLRALESFLPSVVSAVLIMGGGLVLGHFLGGLARNAAAANQLEEADFLGWGVYWVMAVFSGLMALRHLGIDTPVLMNYPVLVAGAACLGGFFLLVHHHKGISFPLLKGNGSARVHSHMVKGKAG